MIFSVLQLKVRTHVQLYFQSKSACSRLILAMLRTFAFMVSVAGRARALGTTLAVIENLYLCVKC